MKHMEKEDIDGLLARHFANEPLAEEQQTMLNRWIASHFEEYEAMRKLIDTQQHKENMFPESAFDAEKAWNMIEPELKGKRAVFTPRAILSVAASVAVLVVMALFFTTRGVEEDGLMHYANNTGKAGRVMLPDSSEVILYPSATLAFSDKDNARQAHLKGKAFFKVKKDHGRTFTVSTDAIEVEVLGTSFLVDAQTADKAGVFVRTGKVKVTAGDENTILHANDKTELKDGHLSSGQIENPDSFFGKNSISITFSDTPLTEVVKEIKDKTGVIIELGEGLEGNTVTTRFGQADRNSMAAELAIICRCKCDTLKAGEHYRLYYE